MAGLSFIPSKAAAIPLWWMGRAANMEAPRNGFSSRRGPRVHGILRGRLGTSAGGCCQAFRGGKATIRVLDLGVTYLLLNHVMWFLEYHPLAKTSLHFIEGRPRTWTLGCPSRKMERPRQVRTSSRDRPLLSPQRNQTKATRI